MVEVEELDKEDLEFLSKLLNSFSEETESKLAKDLLQNNEISQFKKIMPKEYKRVLLAKAKAEQEGLDPIKAIMEASRG